MLHVPYRGSPQALTDVIGGQIDCVFADTSSALGLVQDGSLRVLAVTSSKRLTSMPDIPTVAESGYKDYELELWYGPFAPAKTPTDIIAQSAAWFSRAMKAPAVESKLATQQISPVVACGVDFAGFLRQRSDEFGRAIRAANIKAE